MFLVEDRRHGATFLVFTVEDPRKNGFAGKVTEGVSLDYDLEAVHSWPDGQKAPEACLGRDPNNPKHYKVFKYSNELHSAGYQPVPGMTVRFGSWAEYLKLNPDPGYLEKVDEEEWFERLDEYDEASRRRRQRTPEPDEPADKSRDSVAAWVAKTHRIVDNTIREIWYLPRGAPTDEIRLLEVNDRMAGPDLPVEALDFNLDLDGVCFRLFVADVTSEQLEQIEQNPAFLPPGWSLDEGVRWRRGA